jgi:hypothetical protein
MADMKTRKKTSKAADPKPPNTSVLTRNVPLDVLDWLEERLLERRNELAAKATDAHSRRAASSYSRNDLVVDILSDAMRAARATKSPGAEPQS